MYDLLIIGGGPAGLTAAIYAARANLNALLLEKDSTGLGAVSVSDCVDNYPGLPGIGGYELTERFRAHAERLGAHITIDEITAIRRTDSEYAVQTRYHGELQSHTVIYACGTSHRRLDIPGADRIGVSYCAACDGAFYQNAAVAVIGGGDSALEDALYLSNLAESVYLIHRREEFRANAAAQKQVQSRENITCIMSAASVEIIGSKRVEGMRILHTDSGQSEVLAVDAVFAAIGSIPNTEMLSEICTLDENGYIVADETCVTSSQGLFAAGDVRTTPMRQIVCAAADGANAVQSAVRYLQNLKFS